MNGAIIPFPVDPLRESARLKALHFDRAELEELGADIGTPEEWLSTAILHLKAQVSEGVGALSGSVSVSIAAVSLVLMRLEELDHGGEPWTGSAA
jgi:hypothetical protein